METLSRRLFGKGAGGGDGDAKPGLEAPRLEEDTVVIAAGSPFELRALEVALDMVSWEEGTAQKQFFKAIPRPHMQRLSRNSKPADTPSRVWCVEGR